MARQRFRRRTARGCPLGAVGLEVGARRRPGGRLGRVPGDRRRASWSRCSPKPLPGRPDAGRAGLCVDPARGAGRPRVPVLPRSRARGPGSCGRGGQPGRRRGDLRAPVGARPAPGVDEEGSDLRPRRAHQDTAARARRRRRRHRHELPRRPCQQVADRRAGSGAEHSPGLLRLPSPSRDGVRERAGHHGDRAAGPRVAVVQIASRLVRQIAGYVGVGDKVAQGQRIGVIRLGSQVDVVLPSRATCR